MLLRVLHNALNPNTESDPDLKRQIRERIEDWFEKGLPDGSGVPVREELAGEFGYDPLEFDRKFRWAKGF